MVNCRSTIERIALGRRSLNRKLLSRTPVMLIVMVMEKKAMAAVINRRGSA